MTQDATQGADKGAASNVAQLRAHLTDGGFTAPPADPPPAEEEAGALPEGCPIVPLGKSGGLAFFLDELRQLRAIPAEKLNRSIILDLMQRRGDLIYEYWPRKKQTQDGEWIITGWRPELAQEQLSRAAALCGVWDAAERERGRGGWRGADGELVWHCGDGVWVGPRPEILATGDDGQPGGAWREPGMVGRWVYPAKPAIGRPAAEPASGGDGGPAGKLLEALGSWAWRRGETDAMLLLGWIGAAMLGGALDWRPIVWITGGAGTGKSTLHDLLKGIFDEAVVSVSDASAAGIWQKLGHDTLPVAFDELENEEDNRQAGKVLKLARQAASGGLVLRGGAEHKGSEFVVRSCFLFSSILIPPLLAQDRSRIAVLELEPLRGDGDPPRWTQAQLRRLGAALRRRLADGWHRLPDVLEGYRATLTREGHSARGADQFGTLLACADLLLHDHQPDSESLDAWAVRLAPNLLLDGDEERDEWLCLKHLRSSIVDPYRSGARQSLGRWIEAAGGRINGADAYEANKVLGTFGLRVMRREQSDWLVVAHHHRALAEIYEGTHWGGRAGSQGAWVQQLRRLPGAERVDRAVYFAGDTGRGVWLPLQVALPDRQPADEAMPGELGDGL